jgi:hypothetical protein
MVADASSRQLAVLLLCFDGPKSAAKARRPLETQLRSRGDDVVDTVVLQVDKKHRASVYDPRRVLAGTLTPTVTWALFGVVTGSDAVGVVISAVLGAVLGGLYAYFAEHILTKDQLTRIGARLPAHSSALLIFAETHDPRGQLKAAAGHAPRAASVAAIADDLTTDILADPIDPVEPSDGTATRAHSPDQQALLTMIVLRYPDPATARQVAARIAAGEVGENAPRVELVSSVDRDGRRHVTDPSHGVSAWARSNVISWGGFGLFFGAVAGITGGGGILGLLGNALLTGLVWGVCGLVAGVLYGLWAGQAITGQKLKRLGPLVAPGTSMLLAWADGPVSGDTVDTLATPGSRRLVLRFNPVDDGAVLDTT